MRRSAFMISPNGTSAKPWPSGGYRIDGFNQADAERLATAINNGCRR
jgi:hypothetical protein